jgi:predicted HAD superfamily Cof-like phosphohydrolase
MKTFECGHCGGLNEITGLMEDVRAFHIKFNSVYDGPPRDLPERERKFRDHATKEELEEFSQAREKFLKAKDPAEKQKFLAEMLDARIDLIYFLLGEVYLMGFGELDPNQGVSKFVAGWKRVHDANMAKELSSPERPSKRGPEFNGMDVVKPEGWTAADLTDLCR